MKNSYKKINIPLRSAFIIKGTLWQLKLFETRFLISHGLAWQRGDWSRVFAALATLLVVYKMIEKKHEIRSVLVDVRGDEIQLNS